MILKSWVYGVVFPFLGIWTLKKLAQWVGMKLRTGGYMETSGNLGTNASYSIGIDDKGELEIMLKGHLGLIAYLQHLATETTNTIDDQLVALVAAALIKKS